jgi:TPR repeat protein
LLGIGCEANPEEAARWYRAAADGGQTDAMYNLAVMMATGNGVAKNEGWALDWFRSAALAGHAQAQFEMGRSYRLGHMVAMLPQEAVRWYLAAARQEHAEAQFDLALMIEKGVGVPAPDPATAAGWYTRAAMQHHGPAAHNLGILYAQGLGVEADGDTARELFELAISQGEDAAMFSLGLLLLQGAPKLAQDVESAYMYGVLSTIHDPQGQGRKLLDVARKYLDDAQIQRAQERAQAWQRTPKTVMWLRIGQT